MENKKHQPKASEGFHEILLYTTPNGNVKVEIYLQNETIWLTQQKIAELFGVDRSVVTKHLANIYIEGELSKEATCAKIAQVQTEGNREVNRLIEFYNLDAIISVGYRVNSSRATAFRIWATERLKEYIIKGFTMKDAGKVSHEVALALAETEFDKFNKKQDALYESDFDKLTKTLSSNKKEK